MQTVGTNDGPKVIDIDESSDSKAEEVECDGGAVSLEEEGFLLSPSLSWASGKIPIRTNVFYHFYSEASFYHFYSEASFFV